MRKKFGGKQGGKQGNCFPGKQGNRETAVPKIRGKQGNRETAILTIGGKQGNADFPQNFEHCLQMFGFKSPVDGHVCA